MLKQTNYGLIIDDDGKPNKNELAIDYIVESARSVGIEVIEGKTALDIQFMAEVMKRLREKQEPCEDCISRVEAIKALEYNLSIEVNGGLDKHRTITLLNAICNAQKKAIEDLPSVTPQPKTECSCNQIKWERDTAIAQLKELGYGLGEKPKPDFEHKAEIVISQLRADRDRLQDAIKKIRAEIKEWYWQADKQALAKDPCVVDAMIDLFIRTIDKYTAESEE